MENRTIDRKALVAIGILLVLIVGLAIGLFLVLGNIEVSSPDTTAAGAGSVTAAPDSTSDADPVADVVGNDLESELTIPAEYASYALMWIEQYRVDGALLRDGWIYITGIEYGTIFVERMRPDGSNMETVAEIPRERWVEQIAGFDLAEEGNIRFLFWDSRRNGRFTYAEYDPRGRLVEQWEFADEVLADVNLTSVVTIFLEDGSIVVDAHDGWTCDVLLFVFDPQGEFIHSWRTDFCGVTVQGRDGQIMFAHLFMEDPTLWLYEIDPIAGTWDERFFETEHVMRLLHGAPETSPFDFYIVALYEGERNLYGFNWEPYGLTHLFNWEEKGFWPTARDPMVFLPNGEIVVFRANREEGSFDTFVLAFSY